MNWGDNLLKYVVTFCLMTCVMNAQSQTTADCANLFVVCGASNLSLNSNGIGSNDFDNPNNQPPSCGFTETQSLWLKVPIDAQGLLAFIISANNGMDDFDFAVYGPNVSCSNLGAPIRCSSTNPQAAGTTADTGLRTDVIGINSEGPGALGTGFVSAIPVNAGEEYIILIDNWSQTNAGFQLNWTGDNVNSNPPPARKPENLMECDPDGDGLTTFDLTDIEAEVLVGLPGTIVSYHHSASDALLGNNPILNKSNYENTMEDEEIFARLTANGSSCSSFTSFLLEVNPDPAVDGIEGSNSVCPGVVGVPYKVTGSFITTYDWIVEGGAISYGLSTDSITVDWGAANDDAVIKLVVSNGSGCEIDTVFYGVKVNKRLEPEKPVGQEIV